MIFSLSNRLTGEWQPDLQTANVHLAPPLHLVQKSGAPGAARKIIYLVFSAAAANPEVVLKMVRDPTHNDQLRREFATLNELQERPALQSGIPHPIGLFDHEEHLILAETLLPGRPVNLLLRWNRPPHRHRKRMVAGYLNAATAWLGRFQDSGPRNDTTLLEKEAIAARLVRLPAGWLPPAFAGYLMEQTGRFRGLSLPLVNAHGDFWPGNLLWEEGRGMRGVYDWEAFHPACVPFYDLFLFITTLALECVWVGENRAARFHFGFLADTWLSRLSAGVVAVHFNRYGLPQAAASYLYTLFLLEMATPDAKAGRKQRDQAGPWRARLQQVASAPPARWPFAAQGGT